MCPLCHSKKVRRSHRQPIDLLAVLLMAKPMRCRNCSHRYYRWPWNEVEGSALAGAPVAEGVNPAAGEPRKRSAAAGNAGSGRD